MSVGTAIGDKLESHSDPSFDSAQDDITSNTQNYVILSKVEVLSTIVAVYLTVMCRS